MERRTERSGAAGANRPVPMKLFAAWEVDRTPSNCIPRLCTLRVTRLRVLGALGGGGAGEAGSAPGGGGVVTLAARMHSSKRTLRSNDIAVPPPQPPNQDVELDLCFSLQYPHFVKRDGNRLQIMLQRRKKYKNRTILGYKTLAEGVVRMDQVLQRSMDMELELVSVGGGKGSGGGGGGGTPLARLTITGLASTPVDHDTKNNNLLISAERGYSDEEEEGEFSSVEEADEVAYGTPAAPAARRRQHRNIPYNKADLSYTKQRNLKQKFAALLRRFRVPEELVERGAARDPRHTHTDIDDLFQELESLSCGEGEDSGPDQMDTISIGSTPKPSLRPFFSSSRSLATGGDHPLPSVVRHASVASAGDVPPLATPTSLAPPPATLAPGRERRAAAAVEGETVCSERGSEGNSDGDAAADAPPSGASLSSSPPREKEEKRSRLFRSTASGGSLTAGSAAGGAGGASSARKKSSLSVAGEPRPLLQHDLTQSPTALEPRRSILEQTSRILGEDASALPEAVALVSAGAAPAAVAALASLAVPALSVSAPQDARLFLHALYTRINKIIGSKARTVRVVVCGGDALVAAVLRAYTELAARRPHDAPAPRFYILPLGACCLARQIARADCGYAALFAGEAWNGLCGAEPAPHHVAEVTSRLARYLSGAGGVMSVPIGEAMVACRERLTDEDSSQTFVPFLSEVRVGCTETNTSSLELEDGGSPPARPSPPATPAPVLPACDPLPLSAVTLTSALPARQPDPLELQLDYWQAGDGGGTEGGKVSVKAGFRALHVSRAHTHLQLSTVTKEKKQKIMRLGKKKERGCEGEAGRAHTVDGVSRLICSAKSSHTHPLKVYIDGTEWSGVKFFQLSTQWQTHVKHFPVAIYGAPAPPIASLAPLAPHEA